MKFICSVTIKQPRNKVIDYFMNPEYLKQYQEQFIKKDHISGDVQLDGAIAKMYYKMGRKGEMELTETVLENRLPDYFYAQYHHMHTDNTMRTSFLALDANTTQVDSEIHYTALRGIILKLIAAIYPGMFKKQVQKWLDKLKAFAESKN